MPRRKLRDSHVLALISVQVLLFIKCLGSVRGEIIPHEHIHNAFDASNILSNKVEGFRFSTRRGNGINDSDSSYLDKRLDVDTQDGNSETKRPKQNNNMDILKNVPKQASSFLSDTMLNSNLQRMRRNVRHSLGMLNHKPDDTNMKKKIQKKVSRGKLTVDFGSGISPVESLTEKFDSEFHYNSLRHMVNDNAQGKVEVSMDPLAGARAFIVLVNAALTFGSAFIATLRLLTPLVVSKRVLDSMYNLLSDWYTGRYFRKTYSRIEKIYIHYYETPAAFRAISRTLSQWMVYRILARIMGWLVGHTHPPCRSEGRGLAFFCGLLWIGSVVGAGHAFSTAVALWGGPLRLQAASHPTRTYIFQVFTKPWRILQWMQNPEQWVNLISVPDRNPFNPNPIMFPVTWAPLRLLQLTGVALVASTEPENYIWCPNNEDQIPRLMSRYLLQLALNDEYCRVFIGEKRIGLGIGVVTAYSAAMLSLIIQCAFLNTKATFLFMLPSLMAIIVSGWMNIVIYYNRYQKRRKERNKNPNTFMDQSLVIANNIYPTMI